MSYAEDELAGRPRLSLQPRSSSGDQSNALPAKSSRPNPFGTARPREQVIAEREGKKETEVLKEQAQKEWKPSIVLTEAQREEKKAAEAELAFAKSELTQEFDPVKSKALKEEVASKEKKLEELLGSFEKIAIQTAQTGGSRRPYERRREDDRAQGAAVPVAGNYGAEGQDNYSNFSRGRERDDRGGSYGDTWGAKGGGGAIAGGMGGGMGGAGGRPGGSQCYKCGEMGHFSRECPNAGVAGGRGGSFGGSFGGGGGGRSSGGRSCYTCGQEGHFSRECPQGGGGGFSRGATGGVGGGYPAQSYGAAYGGGGYAPSEYEAAASYASQGAAGGYPAGGYDDRYAGYGSVSGGAAGGYPTGNRWEGYPRN